MTCAEVAETEELVTCSRVLSSAEAQVPGAARGRGLGPLAFDLKGTVVLGLAWYACHRHG